MELGEEEEEEEDSGGGGSEGGFEEISVMEEDRCVMVLWFDFLEFGVGRIG